MSKLEISKEYTVRHTRKGTFTAKVEKINGNTATLSITSGVAIYISEPNRGVGDKIVLFTDGRLCTFKLLT